MLRENYILFKAVLDGKNRNYIKDLGFFAPIGRVETDGGRVLAYLSFDGTNYTEAKGGGETARYIKLTLLEGETALVTVRVGSGYIAERASGWTDAFKRYEGWAGADGIFCFNLTDGFDSMGNAAGKRTLFYFSDTLVSKVNPETLERIEPVYMPNNTYAILDGADPQKPGAIKFYVDYGADGKPRASLEPAEHCYDFAGQGEDYGKAYFWLQDGVVIGDKLYYFPIIVTDYPEGPEGFGFRCLGACIGEAGINGGMPDFKNAKQYAAGLSVDHKGKNIFYGAAVMPYTPEAGYPNGDGYIYIYGGINDKTRGRGLCVARVEPGEITDFGKWMFWDGQTYQPDINESAPLLYPVSCEMSVTPIEYGKNKGKFIAVFQYFTKSQYTAYAIGESPHGPFTEARIVFESDEDKQYQFGYMYNAKAHPHISGPDGLLVSYNVNTTSLAEHNQNGHIYRPLFLLLRDTGA